MTRRLHIVPAVDEANGVWRVAALLAREDGGRVQTGTEGLDAADEVWVHGMWLPREWRACLRALRLGKRLVRMTHGSLSPVYLARRLAWRKRLVAPLERLLLRRADRVVATCEEEADWIRAYEPRVRRIEVTDLRRFFDLAAAPRGEPRRRPGAPLRLLYLGRRHPLKGVEELEEAAAGVEGVELRVETAAFGEAKERAFAWCDALVLPTMSENFGLVVAEALAHGRHVVTTDGAPAWRDQSGVILLDGYRAAPRPERIRLLRQVLARLSA